MSLADWRGIALLGAVWAAGCGGGDALNRGEYVAELNAICEDYNRRHAEIGEPQGVADLVEKGPRIRAAFEQLVDGVRRLEAPPQVAAQHERLLVLGDEQLEVLGALVAAARAGNLPKLQELTERNATLNAEGDAVMRDLGAEACTGP